jgi:hypothetical protein
MNSSTDDWRIFAETFCGFYSFRTNNPLSVCSTQALATTVVRSVYESLIGLAGRFVISFFIIGIPKTVSARTKGRQTDRVLS